MRTVRKLPLALAIATVLLAACTVGSPRASGDLLDRVREAGTLRVANTQANPPWNFVDDNGQLAGYDVDVAHELAERLDIEHVEFIPSTFQNFIEGVRADRFDIVISGQTVTEERKKQVDFSLPYEVNGISVFVKSGNQAIKGPDDLSGRTIAVSAGTTQEAFVQDKIPGATVKTYENATLALTDVTRGNADAALVSRFQGAYLADKNDLAVTPAGPLLETEVNAMSFRQGTGTFQREVDRVIKEMIDDGTLSRISKKWLGGLDMATELKNLPSKP